jgi:UDP-galactopyranose mutase
MSYDAVVIGAGFSGAVIAERLASQSQLKVLVVEKRPHIGGNAYDRVHDSGIMIQEYGPHIFHTNDSEVFGYLSKFTGWNSYVHRVLAYVDQKYVSLPINVETLETLYSKPFTPESAQAFLEQRRIRKENIENARDMVVTKIGEELYELLFRNYTLKQWGIAPEQLDASVTARVPVRFSRDTRYFTDRYQGLPTDGFTALIERILAHPNVEVLLDTDYETVRESLDYKFLIYTGPLDRFFAYKHGRLPYRSLQFDFRQEGVEWWQPVGVVNYPNDEKYTRITEFKHLYQQQNPTTVICYEYPSEYSEPYYPIPTQENRLICMAYEQEKRLLDNTYFVGRLAQYSYINMDQAVARALDLYRKLRRLL